VIHTAGELGDFAAKVAEAPWCAIDTEADSLHSYPEKLCLVQVAIPGDVVLIDPLADLHLEPLWEAFDRHALILHASDYDLHLLATGHNYLPKGIFDTMWAARLLGEPKFGLGDVLEKHLGVKLEKGSQKADWGRRPLTERMTEYALNDVRYLWELKELLRQRLEACGRIDWLRQLCDRLIANAAEPTPSQADTEWRVKGHDQLDRLGLAILRELWRWREKDALRTNRPPFFILRHETLSAVARQAAATHGRNLKLPHYLTPRRREGVFEAVQRGLDLPASERPDHIRVWTRRMTRHELDLAEELKRRRDAKAADLGIDPTIIAARGTLFALARQDAGEWDRLLPWQREILGPQPDPA
jgi:ribonuclease D